MSVEVLSYSGGWQSSTLLWMVIRGDIKTPRYANSKMFAAVTADTGDEQTATYEHLAVMRREAQKAGVTMLLAEGPKIPEDYREEFDGKRIDTIPFWVKKPDGSRGRLQHGCTRHYKVRPVRRAITKWVAKELCISKGKASRIVTHSWIGFSADEKHRAEKIKGDTKTWRTEFPLIELGMTKEDCVAYHRDNGLAEPQTPSVCAGCFANGLRRLKYIHDHDAEAWQRIVERDKYIRNGLERFGVKHECYISSALVPLEDLAAKSFKLPTLKETAEHECDSGVCFV